MVSHEPLVNDSGFATEDLACFRDAHHPAPRDRLRTDRFTAPERPLPRPSRVDRRAARRSDGFLGDGELGLTLSPPAERARATAPASSTASRCRPTCPAVASGVAGSGAHRRRRLPSPPSPPSPPPPPPPPPPSPPSPPPGVDYVFSFTAARGGASRPDAGLQLAEVTLYAATGATITIAGATSSAVPEYPQQGASAAVDGAVATKWFSPSATASLTVSVPAGSAALASYTFTTANDFACRDPASWTVSSGGSVIGVSPPMQLPTARGTASIMYYITSLSPPYQFTTANDNPQRISGRVGDDDDSSRTTLQRRSARRPTPRPTLPCPGPRIGSLVYLIAAAFAAGAAASVAAHRHGRWHHLHGHADPLADAGARRRHPAVGIALYDQFNAPITIASVTNPGGSNPADDREGANSLIDGSLTTKWFDANFARPDGTYRSEIRFHFAANVQVVSYRMATANDNIQRDPACFEFGTYDSNNAFQQRKRLVRLAPSARNTWYTASGVGIISPPSPPAPAETAAVASCAAGRPTGAAVAAGSCRVRARDHRSRSRSVRRPMTARSSA